MASCALVSASASTSAAAYAASAAAYATNAAAYDKEKLIQEQWNYYNELLNFDKNFEEIVLGHELIR